MLWPGGRADPLAEDELKAGLGRASYSDQAKQFFFFLNTVSLLESLEFLHKTQGRTTLSYPIKCSKLVLSDRNRNMSVGIMDG